ncbi:D-amino-acid dehydrogenase [Oceanisphaera litoralis]|uniref:D-amino acid dehydrogenase n=1 Tax=Oceanisphaera litoralis TaxID=225144 RepID=UPI00195980BC|nr:D-amino acid dehydrogenase [Oceanisphaera litoralis]MBM7455057.1 D-amino-acid dehydrogenase [Oceanisphaera litoralis]
MRVAIIGGGVIGLTTAAALVKKGHQVELFEQRDAVAMETSFANGGQLSYRYVSPLADAGVPLQALRWMMKKDAPLRFQPRMSPDQWRWCLRFLLACRRGVNRSNGAHLLRLALHSQSVLRDWREGDGLDGFAWRANGKLVIYRDGASLKKAAAGLPPDSPQQLLDSRQCIAAEPALASLASQLQGGIFSPGDEVGDCYLFCQQLLLRLQEDANFRLHTGQAVNKLRLERGQIRALCLPDGEVAVDHLVVAAGIGSAALLRPLGLKLPLYPLKGYSLTLPVTDHATVPQTNVTDYDRKIVYARLDDQLRVAAMVDIGDWNTDLDASRLASLRQQAQACFPHAGNYQTAKAWAGLRPATPEGTPLLGRSGIKNLWLNTGHGSLGFTLACGSADILASLINSESTAISLEGLELLSRA